MSLHIHFEDDALDYMKSQQELLEQLSETLPPESDIELPPKFHILNGINDSLEPGTRPVRVYFRDSPIAGGYNSGHLIFEIDGIGTFSMNTTRDPVGSPVVVSFDPANSD